MSLNINFIIWSKFFQKNINNFCCLGVNTEIVEQTANGFICATSIAETGRHCEPLREAICLKSQESLR